MAKKKKGKKKKARGVDLKKVREQHEQTAKERQSYGGVDFWKAPPDVKSRVRVMPPWSDDNIPYKEAAYHYGIVKVPTKDGGKRDVALVCPKKTYNQPCPICETAEELFKGGSKKDRELAKSLLSRRRYFYNIVDRADTDAGVFVYGCGITVHQDIQGIMLDPDWGDITDPDEGFDIIVDRKGSTRDDTSYKVRARRNPSPLGTTEEMEEWLNSLYDLDALVGLVEYDDLKLALEDPKKYIKKMEEEREEQGDEDDEAGDEEEEEEEEEEEDEEEEAEDEDAEDDDYDDMSRKELIAYIKENDLDIKCIKSKSDDDYREEIREAEAEEEDEEEEEEKPKKKPKAAKKSKKKAKKPVEDEDEDDDESLTDEIEKTLKERKQKKRKKKK